MNDIGAMLAQMLQQQMDPTQQLRKMAQQAVREHIDKGLPVPAPGDFVRCVFATGRKGFSHDAFVFEEGRVYEVLRIGTDAIVHENETRDLANKCPPELMEECLKNTSEAIAVNPAVAGTFVTLRDPVSGAESCVSFPFYPAAGFVLLDDVALAVDKPQLTDLEAGRKFKFTQLTVVGMHYVQPGVVYTIEKAEPGCACDDPECPGKGRIMYTFMDNDSDLVDLPLPFSNFGVAEILAD